MRVFCIEDVDSAMICRQMIKISAECSQLRWSNIIRDIPEQVSTALEVVDSFAKMKLQDICTIDTLKTTLSDAEEQLLFAAFRKSDSLKYILGSGVVLAGKESDLILGELSKYPELRFITDLLEPGKNLVFL